jgi:hypothetical protein
LTFLYNSVCQFISRGVWGDPWRKTLAPLLFLPKLSYQRAPRRSPSFMSNYFGGWVPHSAWLRGTCLSFFSPVLFLYCIDWSHFSEIINIHIGLLYHPIVQVEKYYC